MIKDTRNCPEKAMKISHFNPNQSAPSIYIMIELCYFSLDQWEIRIHLLWGKSFNIPLHCDPHLNQTKWLIFNDLLPLTIPGVLVMMTQEFWTWLVLKWSTPLLENMITHRARRRPRHHWRQWTHSHWRWWAGHQGRPSGLPSAWHPCTMKYYQGFFCVSLLVVDAWHSNQQLLQDEVKVFWCCQAAALPSANQAAQALAAAAESPSSAAKLQADSWLSRICIIDLWVEYC